MHIGICVHLYVHKMLYNLMTHIATSTYLFMPVHTPCTWFLKIALSEKSIWCVHACVSVSKGTV